MSKKSAQDLYAHTRAAVADRHGHALSREEHAEMGRMIRAREGTLLLHQTGTRFIYRIQMAFGTVHAVYHRPLKAVCTVLEQYMVEQLLREALSTQPQEEEAA